MQSWQVEKVVVVGPSWEVVAVVVVELQACQTLLEESSLPSQQHPPWIQTVDHIPVVILYVNASCVGLLSFIRLLGVAET